MRRDDEARIRYYLSCGTRPDMEDALLLLAALDANVARLALAEEVIAAAGLALRSVDEDAGLEGACALCGDEDEHDPEAPCGRLAAALVALRRYDEGSE